MTELVLMFDQSSADLSNELFAPTVKPSSEASSLIPYIRKKCVLGPEYCSRLLVDCLQVDRKARTPYAVRKGLSLESQSPNVCLSRPRVGKSSLMNPFMALVRPLGSNRNPGSTPSKIRT